MTAVRDSAPAASSGLAASAANAFSARNRFVAPSVEEMREQAFARFRDTEWTNVRTEAWRHTPVSSIIGGEYRILDGGPPPRLPVGAVEALELPQDSIRAVFVNGRFDPTPSRVSRIDGLRIESLRDAIARDAASIAPALARSLAEEDAFTLLNSAFLSDGVVVDVAAGTTVADPIHVVHATEAEGAPLASFPRHFFRLGRNAEATIVVTYAGRGASLTVPVVHVELGENARLDLVTIERQDLAASHIASTSVRQERSSRFAAHAFIVGGAVCRDAIHARLAGEGAECILNGLFMTEGEERADLVTVVDHAVPHGTSRQTYRGILGGRSRGAFTGRVIVRPDAQKTDAWQSNKNLLLSRDALVNSTPALEILADDVKCRHGSTTGQLDDSALFYLRSRGLSEESARSLLTYAFASDLVRRVPDAALRAGIDRAIHTRLPDAPALADFAGGEGSR